MQELVSQLAAIMADGGENPATRVANVLLSSHAKVLCESSDQLETFVTGLSNLLPKQSCGYTETEWNQVILIITAFILSLDPPPNLLPTGQLENPYEPMIFENLIVLRKRQADDGIKKHCLNKLMQIPQWLREMTPTHTPFHARTSLYYHLMMPLMLAPENRKETYRDDFMKLTMDFFHSLCQLDNTEIKYDFLLFGGELMRVARKFEQIPDEFSDLFDALLSKASWAPCQFILSFFLTWYFFAKRRTDAKRPYESIQNQTMIMTDLFQTVSTMKHHELHGNFSWCLCFYFYDFLSRENQKDRKKMLNFICYGMRTVGGLISFSSINEKGLPAFVHTRVSNYESEKWCLPFIMNSLNSSLRAFVYNLNKIMGKTIKTTGHGKIITTDVSFAEQGNSTCSLYHELFTCYKSQVFSDNNSSIQTFEKYWHICNFVKRKLISVAICQLRHFGKGIYKLVVDDCKEAGTLMHCVYESVRIYTKLMILVAYKQELLATFSQKDAKDSGDIPRRLVHDITNPRMMLEIPDVFQYFFEFLLEFPRTAFPKFADIITTEMFKGMKRKQLTHTFINYFSNMLQERFSPTDYMDNLFSYIINKMMEISAANAKLAESGITSETRLLSQWIIFTIALGAAKTNERPNPVLGIILRTYRHIFVKMVLSPRNIADQSTMLKTARIYLQQLKYHTSVLKDTPNNPKVCKSLHYDDFYCWDKVDAIRTVLMISRENIAHISFKQLIPFLTDAFTTNNHEIIEMAADICIQRLTLKKAKKYSVENMRIITLFNNYFAVMGETEVSKGLEILKSVPNLSPWFLATEEAHVASKNPLEIDGLGYNMYVIICALTKTHDNEKETVASLFVLVTQFFETFRRNIDGPHYGQSQLMKTLLLALCHCSMYDFLQENIRKFCSYLVREFGDAFARGESNLFLLSLFDISGSGLSAINKMVLDLAKMFLEYVKQREFNHEMMKGTVTQLLSFFTRRTRAYSMLMGFSLIITYFPQYVKVDQLRSFLVQTTDVSPVDTQFASILNRLLKEFLAIQTRENMEEFVVMVYEIICPLSIGIRNVLMKRVSKLGIPLPIDSLSEIDRGHNILLWYQRLSLAYLCGLRTPIDITDERKKEIQEVMSVVQSMRERDPSFRFEYWSRMLWLVKVIIGQPVLYDAFSDQRQAFYTIICNGLTSRIHPLKKLAKKCFLILKNNYHDKPEFEQFDNIARMSDKKLQFAPQTDHISLRVRLMNLMPERIPDDVVVKFFTILFEYVDKKDSEKLLYCEYLCKILKFFSITKYITSPGVTRVIMDQYKDTIYLHQYLQVIMQLYTHKEIPFKTITSKYVIKFLVNFPNETVQYLATSNFENNEHDLLEHLLTSTGGDAFCAPFITVLQTTPCSDIHLSLMSLTARLVKLERFGGNEDFVGALFQIYNVMLESAIYEKHDTLEEFPILSECLVGIANTFRFRMTPEDVIKYATAFSLPYFNQSHLYYNFKKMCFIKSSSGFREELLRILVEQFSEIQYQVRQIMLPKIIKFCTTIDLRFIWDYIPVWIEVENSMLVVMKAAIELFKKRVSPTEAAMLVLVDLLRVMIPGSAVDDCVCALKFAVIMAENGRMMPKELYDCTLRQILAFQKFGDLPYLPYFLRFLRARPEFLRDISTETTEILITAVQERFYMSRVTKLLAITSSIFISAPELTKHLPFSLVAASARQIGSRISKAMSARDIRNDEFYDINEAIKCLAGYSKIMKISEDEATQFMQVSFYFLRLLVLRGDWSNEYWNTFYHIALQLNVSVFPHELLRDIRTVDNPEIFGLIAVAGKINGQCLLSDFGHLVSLAIEFATTYENKIDLTLLQALLNAIIRSDNDNLKKLLHTAFLSLRDNYNTSSCDRLFLITKVLMESDVVSCLDQLWELHEKLRDEDADTNPLFAFLMQSIEYVVFERQEEYINQCYSEVQSNDKHRLVLPMTIAMILMSTKVSDRAKQCLLKQMTRFLLNEESANLAKIVNTVESMHGFTFNTEYYVIQLRLLQASSTDGVERLVYLEKAIELLPRNRNQRISVLFDSNYIPLSLWQDKYAPLLVSLVAPMTKTWRPLFTLAHRLESVGAELVAVTFREVLDKTNIDIFLNFLVGLLKSKEKLKHLQVISGLMQMFYRAKVRIPVELAQRAIMYTGNIHLLEFFLPTDATPLNIYLMPHIYNDNIFGLYKPVLPPVEAGALAMTLLNEYEAAKKCYLAIDGTPIFNEMRSVNDHFISDMTDLSSLLKPIKGYNKKDLVLEALERAVMAFKNGEKEALPELIQEVRVRNLQLLKKRRFFTSFEKERLMTIESMCAEMLDEERTTGDFSYMNHALVTMFENFTRVINNAPLTKRCVIDGTDPSILLMPSMRAQFDVVCGYTTRGLVAVGKEHIDKYFSMINEKMKEKAMKPVDWRNFSSFTFNIYLARPSDHLFNICFAAYCRILENHNYELPGYIIHEAAARVITMCRLAISTDNASFERTVRSHQDIFKREKGDIWMFWLPQLVELARVNWFCTMIKELINDMSARSYLYAKKDKIQPLEDALRQQATTQITLMDACQKYISALYEVDFTEKQSQDELFAFARETQKLADVEGIDLLELRQREAFTSFTRALSKLSLAQIQLIGDFQEFAVRVKRMNDDELVSFIQYLTGSSHSLDEIKGHIRKATHEINSHLPFIFPLRVERPDKISVMQIQEGFKVLSSDMITIRMVTNVHSWQEYIVQRSENAHGYHKSVLTLSNTLYLFREILQRTYSARCRNLRLFPSQVFEIGCSIIIIPVMSSPVSFESLFKQVTMMTCNEWLTKYVRSDVEQPPRFYPYDRTATVTNRRIPYADQSTLHLTEEGLESAMSLPGDALKRKMLKSLTEDDFLKMRAELAKSQSVSFLVRHLFNAPYPSMQKCVSSSSAGSIPILHSDYDHGMITSTEESPFSAFRVSPNIINSLGTSINGESLITMAVMAKALIKNIESVRSWIETMIGDEDFDAGRVTSLSGLIEKRTLIENRVLELCPPRVANVSPETCEEWIVGIEQFLNKSADPSVQPIEAIPWF